MDHAAEGVGHGKGTVRRHLRRTLQKSHGLMFNRSSAHEIPDTPAGNWSLAQQSRGELTPAVSTTRTGHAAVPQHGMFAEISRRSCFSSQPLQSGTCPLQQRQFQTKPKRRSGRVAPAFRRVSFGVWWQTETGPKPSDGTLLSVPELFFLSVV